MGNGQMPGPLEEPLHLWPVVGGGGVKPMPSFTFSDSLRSFVIWNPPNLRMDLGPPCYSVM